MSTRKSRGLKVKVPKARDLDRMRDSVGLEVGGQPREMELLGVQKDDRLVVWDRGMVEAISKFQSKRPYGYYIVEYKGSAVCAHIPPQSDGLLRVQMMGWGLPIIALPFEEVEHALLGRVIPDPVKQAEISRLLNQIEKNLSVGLDAPHKQRGRAGRTQA